MTTGSVVAQHHEHEVGAGPAGDVVGFGLFQAGEAVTGAARHCCQRDAVVPAIICCPPFHTH
jgi:hypothetical protein